ncbi:MAG: SixA phosphatase family protein [Bdellovibrionales bacterium]
MIQLVLIRHSVALEREEFQKKTKLDDAFRPLTMKGRRRLEKVSRMMKKRWVKQFDMIITSPYTRAKQSAQIISQVYDEQKIVESAELVPQSPPQAFVKWMRSQNFKGNTLAIVGHEPNLSLLATYLLAGNEYAFLEFKKAGLMCLEIDMVKSLGPSSAQLQWLIAPKMVLSEVKK